MKTHVVEGDRMLDRIGGALAEVGVAVRASHERYDGKGYPDGLVGDDIPIAARLISCCDAFDAMTTDRPYRAALPQETAIAELREHSGSQFDPVVVEALIEVIGSWQPAPAPVKPATNGRSSRPASRSPAGRAL